MSAYALSMNDDRARDDARVNEDQDARRMFDADMISIALLLVAFLLMAVG